MTDHPKSEDDLPPPLTDAECEEIKAEIAKWKTKRAPEAK